MDFFYDKEKDYEKIELHYLSNTISYGIEKIKMEILFSMILMENWNILTLKRNSKKSLPKIDFQR